MHAWFGEAKQQLAPQAYSRWLTLTTPIPSWLVMPTARRPQPTGKHPATEAGISKTLA
jgi:hypothetical protein